MALPINTSVDDIRKIVRYLARKPAGASIADATTVLTTKIVDSRKIAATQVLGILSREDGKLRLTPDVGRAMARDDNDFESLLRQQVAKVDAYRKCLERAYHHQHDSIKSEDVGAFWYENCREDLGTDNEREIQQRASCFLQIASGAGLGEFILGRKGQPTRLVFDRDALEAFINAGEFDDEAPVTTTVVTTEVGDKSPADEQVTFDVNDRPRVGNGPDVGTGIFIGHGKNKAPLGQLKAILDEFKIKYRVVTDEPHLGRPISQQVREALMASNCAVMIFTADEEFRDIDGKQVYRPSENVIHELGAASFLFEKRIVILKEDGVTLPSNFSDLGYIPFDRDKLDSKAMELIKELVGFGILRIST